jgi:hypothetical protein
MKNLFLTAAILGGAVVASAPAFAQAGPQSGPRPPAAQEPIDLQNEMPRAPASPSMEAEQGAMEEDRETLESFVLEEDPPPPPAPDIVAEPPVAPAAPPAPAQTVSPAQPPSEAPAQQGVLPTQTIPPEQTATTQDAASPRAPGQATEELPPVETRTGNPMVEEMVRRAQGAGTIVSYTQIPSLFFTNWEESLIEEARLGLTARAATLGEIDDANRLAASGARAPIGPREISLGGIVFSSGSDWVIWLNGQKITPTRIPPEILDIQVTKDVVRLKWFDAYTNQIFPIKLRTHQRFNIDSRIFLPG